MKCSLGISNFLEEISSFQFYGFPLFLCTDHWGRLPYLSSHYLKSMAAAAAAKSLQSRLTLCYPIDGSPPGSPVPGILQARTLVWVAISSSDAWKWKVKVKSLSRVELLATPWTAAHQAPPSMGFSRQECWSGVPLPFLKTKSKVAILSRNPTPGHISR